MVGGGRPPPCRGWGVGDPCVGWEPTLRGMGGVGDPSDGEGGGRPLYEGWGGWEPSYGGWGVGDPCVGWETSLRGMGGVGDPSVGDGGGGRPL